MITTKFYVRERNYVLKELICITSLSCTYQAHPASGGIRWDCVMETTRQPCVSHSPRIILSPNFTDRPRHTEDMTISELVENVSIAIRVSRLALGHIRCILHFGGVKAFEG
jgi:hypothetical protein